MLTFLFIFSFFGILLLLAVKVYETKKEKQVFILKALSRLDNPIENKLSKVKERYVIEKERAEYMAKVELPRQSKEMFFAAKDALQQKYVTMLPNIRGSRILTKAGEASEFLRDITEHKKENGRGRIDEI
jgi:hypothetical protein